IKIADPNNRGPKKAKTAFRLAVARVRKPACCPDHSPPSKPQSQPSSSLEPAGRESPIRPGERVKHLYPAAAVLRDHSEPDMPRHEHTDSPADVKPPSARSIELDTLRLVAQDVHLVHRQEHDEVLQIDDVAHDVLPDAEIGRSAEHASDDGIRE